MKKHYRTGETVVCALDGPSISVGQGECTGVLGTSGSRKSTLLNLIAGLDPPTRGAIIFSVLLSLLAGSYPASRAARLDPIQALRHD